MSNERCGWDIWSSVMSTYDEISRALHRFFDIGDRGVSSIAEKGLVGIDLMVTEGRETENFE